MTQIIASEPGSGQEQIKPLSTANAVSAAGTLIRPQEPVVIIGTGDEKTGGHFLGTDEHTVHRVLAAKLVAKGAAKYKFKEDEAKQKEIEKAEEAVKK